MGELALCRLCASEKDNLVTIYNEDCFIQSNAYKIRKCLNIEVNKRDNLPKAICNDCCGKLDAFNEFIDSSLSAQETLLLLFPVLLQESPKSNVLNDSCISDSVRQNLHSDFGVDNLHNIHSESDLSNESEVHDGVLNSSTNSDSVLDSVPSKDCSNGLDIDNGVGCEIFEETHDWPCSDCSEALVTVEELRLHHAVEHKQEVRYMCRHCSKIFFEYASYLSHYLCHRNGVTYMCNECGRGFPKKKLLELHYTTHSNIRPYVCHECGKSFRQQNSLLIHSKCHLPEAVKNRYPCDQCNKRFTTKPNLETHMRIHSGVRNYTCDQCGKSFIQKGNLDAHLLTHSHDKPFPCDLCNKRFKTSMQLKKHHSVHTGAKPHQCNICGRMFREKGTLREHHRIHTGAMPFTCEYCGKSFRFKSVLTTHRRQHTGERPYSCVECQHHFTNWPNYNKHMKRKHGINTSNKVTRTLEPQKSTGGVDEVSTLPTSDVQLEAPPGAPTNHLYTQDISPHDVFTMQTGPTLPPHIAHYVGYNMYGLPASLDPVQTTGIDILPR